MKLQEINREKKCREEDTEEDSLVEALQIDGDNLRLNFNTVPDDESDKSLEIPPSIETDLAKDIDRILAMTAQLEDIAGDSGQVFSCSFCHQNQCQQPPLASQNELNEHLKHLHWESCFMCDSCENMIDRNSLIEHMMQHLKETQFQVLTEVTNNANENNDSSNKVVEVVQTKKVAKNLMNKEEILLVEDDEGEGSKDKKNLLLKEAAGSNVKFLKKCKYCDKLFSNRSGRLYHQEQAHFNRRRFRCDQCDLSFGLKQTLMNHIRNKHSNNVRAFSCDMCCKSYKTKAALHNHRVYHSKDDPKYHCNYCEKKFHFNFLLQQHETIHLGISKTFDCTVCQKSFNTRNKLTKHRGIHDNNQFSCTKEGCSFKGSLKRYLYAHMKRMHP